MLQGLADEWHAFRDDQPGHRFRNHYRRMHEQSSAVRIGAIALGVLLVSGGIVLLFIPGPGLLVMLFGLALFGGMFKPLARALDRAEPPVRRKARSLRAMWRSRSTPVKVLIVVAAAVLAAAAAYGLYRFYTR